MAAGSCVRVGRRTPGSGTGSSSCLLWPIRRIHQRAFTVYELPACSNEWRLIWCLKRSAAAIPSTRHCSLPPSATCPGAPCHDIQPHLRSGSQTGAAIYAHVFVSTENDLRHGSACHAAPVHCTRPWQACGMEPHGYMYTGGMPSKFWLAAEGLCSFTAGTNGSNTRVEVLECRRADNGPCTVSGETIIGAAAQLQLLPPFVRLLWGQRSVC